MRNVHKILIVLFVLALSCSSLFAQSISGTVTLTAVATDVTPAVGDTECGVGSVQFFLGTTPLGPALTVPNSGTNYTFSWNTTMVPNGAYTLTAKATDKAGLNGACDSTKVNIGTSNALNVTVNNIPPDVAPPTITITISAP
jgi:hypothetical protein